MEVKSSELGIHHTGGTGGLLPSPCLTQFLEGWSGRAAFSKHLWPCTAALLWHCLHAGGFSELLSPCLRPWE